MHEPHATQRLCPTRADGVETLIAHWIAPSCCQERQRTHYHKCFTCAHRNGAEAPRARRTPVAPTMEGKD